MRTTLSILLPIALVAACSGNDATETHAAKPSSGSSAPMHADKKEPTAMDQSNTPADLDHVAEIRKKIVGDEQLSTMAKNVTVVTKAGVVTLRGKVPTAADRTRIEQIAEECAATTAVHDELEVESK